jgi:hypothetical protein
VRDAVTPFERLPYVVLITALLVVGCWPGPLLRIIDAGSRPLIERMTLALSGPPARPAAVSAQTTATVRVEERR